MNGDINKKAKELVERYNIQSIKDNGAYSMTLNHAKQCALIAVDLVIKSQPFEVDGIDILHSNIPYWADVKREIEKI